MASVLEGILDRVVTDLKVSHAHFDLSDTDGVKLGRYHKPWKSPPCACVFLESAGTTRQADGLGPVPLGQYGREIAISIVAWAGLPSTAANDAESRQRVATRIGDDCLTALEADRTLNSQVLDSESEIVSVDGEDETVAASHGVGVARISLRAWRRGGGA